MNTNAINYLYFNQASGLIETGAIRMHGERDSPCPEEFARYLRETGDERNEMPLS